MHGTNWLRIILSGVVAGIVWFLLCAAILFLFAQDFLASLQGTAPHPPMGGAFFFALDLMMGIWAMWLYSAIAPRYGAGAKTAAIAGVAWWTIKSLQSAKWAGLGFVPREVVLVPLATTLIAAVTASLVGAWVYRKVV